MFAEERQMLVLSILEKRNSVTVAELSKALKVTEATVRRDLNALQARGLVIRTHGGAMLPPATGFEPTYSEKEDRYFEEKQKIGARAAELIKPGETIILDAGTTTLQIARHLEGKRGITVITNGLNLIQELTRIEGIEVVFTGGTVRSNTMAVVGPVAQETLRNFHADKVFLAGNGISLTHGLTTPSILEAYTKRAMADAAREVIVVVDHSKFNVVTATRVLPLSRVHKIITDDGLPPSVRLEFAAAGIEIIVAGKEDTVGPRGERPSARLKTQDNDRDAKPLSGQSPVGG